MSSRIVRHCCGRAAVVSSLALFACGPSGDFELAAVGASLEPSVDDAEAQWEPRDDDAPFRWDPRDYAARDVPPPSRAGAWSWPSLEDFRARFEERGGWVRSYGVIVGRNGWVDSDGSEIRDQGRHAQAVVAGADGTHSALVAENPYLVRGVGRFAWLHEVSGGDPFVPGRIHFGLEGTGTSFFDVEYAAAPRRLLDEDFRDWVYARTLVESGRELAEANAVSVRQLVQPADADAHAAAEASDSQLAVDCYESGLVGCYFAARLGLVVRRVDVQRRPLSRPVVEPKVLARGPVDLPRFFIGYLLDEMEVFAPSVARSEWSFTIPHWVPLAIFDSGHAPAVKDELFRRACDPARDTWTRVRMIMTLTALLDVDGVRPDEWPRKPYEQMAEATPECALTVLAEPLPTMNQAYERCVARPRRAAARLAAGNVSREEGYRLIDELRVEPP